MYQAQCQEHYLIMSFIYNVIITNNITLCNFKSSKNIVKMSHHFSHKENKSLEHRWQTQGLWPESSLPPCFIQPGTLFLPSGSAKHFLNC